MARTAEPTLGIRGLRPVISGLRALGHDPAPLLARVGLVDTALADPDGRVPAHAVMRLLSEGATSTGDPDLGMHLAAAAAMADFDVHAYAMQSSATLGEAYERLCRYQRLIHDTTNVSLIVEGDQARLCHTLPGGLAIPRQSAEFVVAAWLRIGRLISGTEWTPLEVRFAHPAPDSRLELERYFGCRLLFSAGENAMILPAALLHCPSVSANPGLAQVLERHAGTLLDKVPAAHTVAESVRAALPRELHGGDVTAAAMARRLGMSARTLHRSLAGEGASFHEIVDRHRHEEAVRALSDARLAIADIAFDLGFAELSSFYRAFKRWTGTTPAEYRRRMS